MNQVNFEQEFATLHTVTSCIEKRDEISNSGRFSEIKSIIKSVSTEEKKILGAELNQLKKGLWAACDKRIGAIQKELEKDVFTPFDPTFASSLAVTPGHHHIITKTVREIISYFAYNGFDVYDKNTIATQEDNFTVPNTPDYHPARSMQDTFFLKETDENNERYVMRTQVTSNLASYAKTHAAPFRVIFPGLVFRAEDIDATHDINFTQFDMWLVDKNITMSHLLTIIKDFITDFFNNPDAEIRLRQSYFPFTLPSFEVDMQCQNCKGAGCRVCKKTGWIEIAGAGPIHPNVLENIGLDHKEWSGIAFGFGVDRLAQLKYGLKGISQFYNGDVEFLEKR